MEELVVSVSIIWWGRKAMLFLSENRYFSSNIKIFHSEWGIKG
ncbi:MAG: hypothetical protein SPL26_08030 [Bacteroidales bacterium]|nr:hypothetical protein [Bacteroidales bacterium]MDY6385459.1 hypothetical protein [Bacteroidales bacterium]